MYIYVLYVFIYNGYVCVYINNDNVYIYIMHIKCLYNVYIMFI
jgi:hypothetical protein